MVLFPLLALLVLLVLCAAALICGTGILRGLVNEHRVLATRPAARVLVIVRLAEVAVVLVWGLLLRSH